MGAYHTNGACQARLARRSEAPQAVAPLGVFYHIACMGNWHEVVREQLRLLAHVDLTRVTSAVLGTEEDARWCREAASRLGVDLTVPVVSGDLSEFEHPTLCLVYQWAREN